MTNWKRFANCHIFRMRWSIEGGSRSTMPEVSASTCCKVRLRAAGIVSPVRKTLLEGRFRGMCENRGCGESDTRLCDRDEWETVMWSAQPNTRAGRMVFVW